MFVSNLLDCFLELSQFFLRPLNGEFERVRVLSYLFNALLVVVEVFRTSLFPPTNRLGRVVEVPKPSFN